MTAWILTVRLERPEIRYLVAECWEVILSPRGRPFLAPFALVMHGGSLPDLEKLRALGAGAIVPLVVCTTVGALGVDAFLHLLAVSSSVRAGALATAGSHMAVPRSVTECHAVSTLRHVLLLRAVALPFNDDVEEGSGLHQIRHGNGPLLDAHQVQFFFCLYLCVF